MEINVNKPHDSFFKKVFRDVNNTRDFLKSYLPKELSKRIDFNTMTMSDTEKDDAKYKKSYLDLSVQCRLDDKESQIYIIFEHKAYRDNLTIIQILSYCLLVWEDEIRANKKTLTPIIPFIFYHGEGNSGLKTNFKNYFDVTEDLKKYLLNFEILIFDTSKKSNEEIKQNINNLFLVSALLMMKNIFKDKEQIKPILKEIIELSDDRKIILFEYFATKKQLTEETFNELMIELKGDEMPSVARIWMERGKEEGKIEGKIEGIVEEIHSTIKMGFEFKFKQLSKKLLLAIQKINEVETLKEIKKAIFDINDADEFQRFLKSRIQVS
jgi:predicted transposase/invertase (TIGR01784 family)